LDGYALVSQPPRQRAGAGIVRFINEAMAPAFHFGSTGRRLWMQDRLTSG
jgi:hypothetical protein